MRSLLELLVAVRVMFKAIACFGGFMTYNRTQRTFSWLLRTDVVREDDEDEEEEEEEDDPEARLFLDAQHDAQP